MLNLFRCLGLNFSLQALLQRSWWIIVISVVDNVEPILNYIDQSRINIFDLEAL